MGIELTISIIAAAIAAGAAVAAIYSAYYAKVSMKQQREQWINQEFIKREADVLLEFRQALLDSVESMNWVRQTILRDQPFVHFMLTTNSKERTQVVAKHFCKLNRLKELYNSHILIFRKHRLNEKMPHVFAILDVMDYFAVFSEMAPIDKALDQSSRTKIIMEMNSEQFKEIVERVLDGKGVPAAELQKMETDKDIAHTLQCYHITLSLAFMLSFNKGPLAILWTGGGERLKAYGETAIPFIKTKLSTNKYEFDNHLTASWNEFQQELKWFLFGMDEITTYEGKLPEDIRELEKLSYPHAEKMFLVVSEQGK